MRTGRLISKYLVGSVVPYFVFAWVLLSVILFFQQASRFYDIFFSVNIPTNLIWQLTIALVPNVIAFTCPMAVLVGVIIGLSKMQGDGELVAIRAAGVGNLQVTVPILVLGVLLSGFAFLINLYGVPLAARIVRQVAIQTAIFKLESPIEPGVFNTEIGGYTIYVKDGDLSDGQWKNIFVYHENEKEGETRLITSSNGRIDTTDQNSELVLENAVASTFKKNADGEKFVSERIGEVRIAIKTRRGELIEKLSSQELTPEELGLAQLSQYAGSKEGQERVEAQILWQRRIILSVTPLIFCLLGTAMVLRFQRSGRGFGIFLALVSLIVYYLLAFLGEQLARTGKISVVEGSFIPIVVSVFAIAWFSLSFKLNLSADRFSWVGSRLRPKEQSFLPRLRRNLFIDVTTGLRDFDLIVNLAKYYFLTLGFLAAVFVIFTAFELWKFAGIIDGGVRLLINYLLFLLPFVYIQLAPSAAMIAVLATYVIKSRQNEIVTWTSAGQSVYRILVPCMVFMAALGIINWQIQERLAPKTNQTQDELRTQLRSRGVTANQSGKYWVANDARIYSFEIDKSASDNETRYSSPCSTTCGVKNLTIYEFESVGHHLQTLYRVPSADWGDDKIVFAGEIQRIDLKEGRFEVHTQNGGELAEASNPFGEIRKKPSHLTTSETREQLRNSDSEIEQRSFGVALQKKYSTIILPLIIAAFTAPFALSLSRKGKAVTVGYAVGLWLLFMGTTSAFDQLGLNGNLSPVLAVWAPLVLFAMLGTYLLSRVKT